MLYRLDSYLMRSWVGRYRPQLILLVSAAIIADLAWIVYKW